MVKINYWTVDWKDYLVPFEELKDDQIPQSSLEPRVQEFMKLITTAKGYWESLNTHWIDTGVVNLSNLDKTLLDKAEDILDWIAD